MNLNTNQNNNEFKTLGMNIENFSIIYGIFLVFWGIIISFISGSDSLTSYIPSFLGIPILIFAFLSIKFTTKKKMFMHIVVLFGLIIFIGGLDFIRSLITGVVFENLWADVSKLMMMLTGFFFTYQCIRSFIHSRKMREIEN